LVIWCAAYGAGRPSVERPLRLAWRLTVLVSALYLVSFIVRTLTDMQITHAVPPILNALFALPALAIVLTIGSLVFTVLAWKDRYWGVLGRLHYTLVTLAALAFIPFLHYWNLLGFRS
jgi:hypothetical protein